jgi:hypothetical protein
MKTLKQLREEYDIALPQASPEDLVLEDVSKPKSEIKSLSDVPSQTAMPNLLMFRRITYRRYPGNQTVALYYSKTVDKYLSVPFGPKGNINLNEASVYDSMEELDLYEGAKWEAVKGGLKGAAHGALRGAAKGNAIAAEPGMAIGAVVGAAHGAYKGAKTAYNKAQDMEEDWQDVNRKDKTDGLSQKAVNAYRRENPGSKLKTAVTEKNPTGKRASRRKSFCSRMGGMKKRLTSAKNARDPDSPINKALRRWNCEEDFKLKLAEKRMEEGVIGDTIEKGRKWAQDKVKDSATFKAAQELGHNLPGYGNVKAAKEKWSKGDTWGAAKEAGKSVAKAAATGAAVAGVGGVARAALSGAARLVAGAAAAKAATGGDNKPSSQDTGTRISTDNIQKRHITTKSPTFDRGDSAIDKSRQKTLLRKDAEASNKKQVSENKISDLRQMVNEGSHRLDMKINGRPVHINTSMAKRILEVYDSVNTKNKKIVESMLNEDLESFKKLLNFSIKA